jgi:transposase
VGEYIAFDSHKHYTLAEREDSESGRVEQCKLAHDRGTLAAYLARCEPGTAVAVEATGNWYWIVGEIEQAAMKPLLVHPRKAKLMMGMVNKTDKLDAHGLNRLQRNKTLPIVWIPPAELRDLRELTRTRLVLGAQRTRLKNRISATLAKYGFTTGAASDPFGKKARTLLEQRVQELPTQARWVTEQLLSQLDFVVEQMKKLEQRLQELVHITPEMKLLQSLPGIGTILAATIALEIGNIERFPTAQHLASYSGTTPRVHASGGRVRYGRMRTDVNHYLKWAFAEAGNSVAVNHPRYVERHVSQLYVRLRDRKGHPKAIGAVARHLAEATFYVLHRQQEYRDPALQSGLCHGGVSATVS